MARYSPRLIYIVLDGAGDTPGKGETSLEAAETPNLDYIASRSKAGLVYVLGMGVAPQSDAATMSLLGYSPYEYRVGRGVLEALGLGVKIRPGYELALRGNLATVDDDDTIVDRRCGRDVADKESGELLAGLEYVELGRYGGYAKVYPSKGHRVAVVIGSRMYRLDPHISNIDPAYKRVGYISEAVQNPGNKVLKCEPLRDSGGARIAAELVNIFYELSREYLKNHPINSLRREGGRLPCNAILLRDAGDRPENIPMFPHKFGFKMASVVEMPVERGIAELIGLVIADIPDVKFASERYMKMAERAVEILEFTDAVYIHIKGADEPAHDGDREGKVKALEMIDKYFVGSLLESIDMDNTAILVTCDHATPPDLKSHSADPVPIYIYRPGYRSDGIDRFSENLASGGSLGLITGGWDIIPLVKRMVWG